MTTYVKGAGIRSGLEWLEKTYGRPALDKMIASLPGELRDAARAPLASSWYPIGLLAGIYTALPTFTPARDRVALERVAKDLNRYVAEANLSTLYRALLVLMTPERLFSTLPRMWSLYFKGIEAQIVRDPDGSRGTCRVHGLGQVPYLAPGAIGWLELAFKKVGGNLQAHEEGWAKGRDRGDPLVFHLDWSQAAR
jgi:hypothetical protein